MSCVSSVLGILRFSVVFDSPRGFPTLAHLDRAKREAIVFNPERMEARHRLLSEILLPSLKAQTDPDFAFAILVTDNLPDRDMQRLRKAIRAVPQVRIVTVPTQRQLRFGCRMAMKRMLDPAARKWATFRIDDDDALASDFIAELRARTEAATEPTALSFVRGVELALTGNGALVAHRDTRPGSSAGLALLSQLEAAEFNECYPSVYQLGPHRKVGNLVPMEKVAERAMYLRLLHGGNVSTSWIRDVPTVPEGRLDTLLRRRFPGLPREMLKNLASDPALAPQKRPAAE